MEAILAIIFLAVYLIPTIVAVRHKKAAASGIFLLNLLLGWTILGWIVALIWAVNGETQNERDYRYGKR